MSTETPTPSTPPPPVVPLPADVEETAAPMVHLAVPVTLTDLAAHKSEAIEIIESRIQILTTLRKAALRATYPEDWLLFRTRDGRVTGYLQDAGAERVRDLYGIDIYNLGRPERVNGLNPGEFTYLVSGDGRCRLTGQVLEGAEGGRSSGDDFCRDRTGVELELAVRKAARANLDGNITRELAGLKNVPLDELKAAWEGTKKSTEHCRLGRGFGTQAERQGAETTTREQPTDIEPPVCESCGKPMRFVAAGKSKSSGKAFLAFWSCPDFKKVDGQGNGHSTIGDAAYRERLAQEASAGREPGSNEK